MPGTSRFDCFPSDFLNGIIGLKADEVAAYTVLMMMQYDRGVAIQYVGREREIAIRSGMPVGRLKVAVDSLVDLGKLSFTKGCLSQARVEAELEKISKRISKNKENSQKGGEASKNKREAEVLKLEQKPIEINGDDEPSGPPPGQPSGSPPGQPVDSPTCARPSSPVLRPSESGDNSEAQQPYDPAAAQLSRAKRLEPHDDGPDDEFRRAELACRAALGEKTPIDPVFGPVMLLIDRGFSLRDVVTVLRSEAQRPRKKPIRSWMLWAEIITERIAEIPKGAAGVLNADGQIEIRVDFTGGYSAPVSSIRAAVERGQWPGHWGPMLGQPGCRVPPDIVEMILEKPKQQGVAA